MSTSPPFASASSLSPAYPFNSLTPTDMSSISSLLPPSFPPSYLDDLAPAGIFVGVFSMDSAVERRMLVRSTWASHMRSRNGAGPGDNGVGTSRTIVRFVLGKPRKHWERRVQLEAESMSNTLTSAQILTSGCAAYNDMIVLPIAENMNSGKTYSFFSWASTEAWVPSVPTNSTFRTPAPSFSYSNTTAGKHIPLAKHDPLVVQQEWLQTGEQTPWVRPDYVVKVDDDSFVMLAELETRLRVELHRRGHRQDDNEVLRSRDPSSDTTTEVEHDASSSASAFTEIISPRATPPPSLNDPLIYWGYLVKNQFMAGELYSLSWGIVEWIRNDPTVKGMTKGKEDKQVAKWMRLHPRAQEVRWVSERCWIYDHPRAGTV